MKYEERFILIRWDIYSWGAYGVSCWRCRRTSGILASDLNPNNSEVNDHDLGSF